MKNSWRKMAVLLAAGLMVVAAAFYFISSPSSEPVSAPPTEEVAARPTERLDVRPIEPVGRYNVVLLSMDTARRDHLSMYGYKRDTSPRLSEMAAEGVVFDQAIAANTNTAPSHATMLTGLTPAQHGITRNGGRLTANVPVLTEILRNGGYRTGAFVSAYTLSSDTGLNRGFDVYDEKMFNNTREAKPTVAATQPWLKETAQSGQRFFLFVHLFDPHGPYAPPNEFARPFLPEDKKDLRTTLGGRYKGEDPQLMTAEEREEAIIRYDGEIAFADHYMGLLLDELKGLGVFDDTLIVLLSDHGETLEEREWGYDHGARVYDEQILVPLVMRLPGGAHGGKRVANQVGHVDVMPTILDILAVPIPEGVSGLSLLPLIEGKADEQESRPAFTTARVEPERSPEIATGDGRFPLRFGLISAIRLPRYKLIEYPMEDGTWYSQLFDLKEDPGETRNLVEERPVLFKQLRLELDEWRREKQVKASVPEKLAPSISEKLRSLGYAD